MRDLKYKNISRSVKQFHDVVFQPGEIHDVKGYINDPKFVRVPDSLVEVAAPVAVTEAASHIGVKTVKETDKQPTKSSTKQSSKSSSAVDTKSIKGDSTDKQGGKS